MNIVITGASTGIGYQAALRLASLGHLEGDLLDDAIFLQGRAFGADAGGCVRAQLALFGLPTHYWATRI